MAVNVWILTKVSLRIFVWNYALSIYCGRHVSFALHFHQESSIIIQSSSDGCSFERRLPRMVCSKCVCLLIPILLKDSRIEVYPSSNFCVCVCKIICSKLDARTYARIQLDFRHIEIASFVHEIIWFNKIACWIKVDHFMDIVRTRTWAHEDNKFSSLFE